MQPHSLSATVHKCRHSKNSCVGDWRKIDDIQFFSSNSWIWSFISIDHYKSKTFKIMEQKTWQSFLSHNYEPSKILHIDNANAKPNQTGKPPKARTGQRPSETHLNSGVRYRTTFRPHTQQPMSTSLHSKDMVNLGQTYLQNMENLKFLV